MMIAKVIVLSAAIVVGFLSQAAGAPVIHIRDHGAVGDGETDDGPAVRKALATAIQGGPGTKLVFDKRTYRFGPYRGGSSQIELTDVNGLTIEGNGATLLLHPQNGIFSIRRCLNILIRGFVIDFDPLPFTQGTIRAVRADEGVFEFELHAGYPLPPSDAIVKKRLGEGGWRWGTVIDPKERHRRWGIPDHYRIASVDAIGGRIYRIKVTPSHKKGLKPVLPGDRFFLPLMLTEKGERVFGENIAVRESADCILEGITIYSGRSGMNYSINRNEGLITLRNNTITFRPSSSRLCSTWKDGMHVKDNRVGPLIEGCHFEGMLDDSINISANTAMAINIISPKVFRLMGPAFSASDAVMIFDPQSGKTQMTKVIETKVEGETHTVTLADSVEDVIVGRKQREHIKSTHFYNMSYINDGFIVRDCIFKPQRRHAMLVRSPNGIIDNNTIDGVGGAAVWMGNEMGSFYEGPFPQNNIIRNNTIRNTQLTAIHIYTRALNRHARHTSKIRVENNRITVLPEHMAISVRNAAGVELKSNRILDQTGQEIDGTGVILTE